MAHEDHTAMFAGMSKNLPVEKVVDMRRKILADENPATHPAPFAYTDSVYPLN